MYMMRMGTCSSTHTVRESWLVLLALMLVLFLHNTNRKQL